MIIMKYVIIHYRTSSIFIYKNVKCTRDMILYDMVTNEGPVYILGKLLLHE